MGTINHINAARNNTFIGMECEREHAKKRDDEGPPPWLRKVKPVKVDPYTRRSNVCKKCFMTMQLDGEHECE
jgi:hypothetical protein